MITSYRNAVFALVFTLVITPSIHAQPQRTPPVAGDSTYTLDTIVVTATRIETPVKEVASSITVVTDQDIERKRQETVLAVLRGTPGLDVVQSGGPGGNTALFLRGAEADYTLVLIDGVEMNDPISTGRAFDFANLTTDNIDRIEVLRGPQSTLYGSDAIGGVVNIITRRGQGPPKLSLSTQGGSLGTARGQGGISGGNAVYAYALTGSWLRTSGISSANESLGNTEKDGHRNGTVSGKFGLTPRQYVQVEVMFRYTDTSTDIDNGAGGDDPNRRIDARQVFLRPQLAFTFWDSRWKQVIGYAFSDLTRQDIDPVDANQNASSESRFSGRIHRIDWQNTLHLHEYTTFVFGLETEQEQGSSASLGAFPSTFPRQSARLTGFYLQDQIHYRDLFFAALGFRVDHHSLFGTEATYRMAPAVLIGRTGIRLKGAYGTGFKAPSLFQLYSPFGSPTLQAGTSSGWEVGVEHQALRERLVAGVTYFRNTFTNMVDFDLTTFTYNNIFKAETQGVEWSGRINPYPGIRFGANYTFTDTEDKTTRLPLVRRPRHKWGFDAGYAVGTRADVNASVLLVGARQDNDFSTFPAVRKTLAGYQVVNVAASYTVMPHVRLFGRIDNLFNETYEEVIGFGTPGASAYFGVKWSR